MKKIGILALLLVLLPIAREYAQENADEAIKIYQELAGEYEFYVPKAYVLARVFVDKGMLWTQDEGKPVAERVIPADSDGEPETEPGIGKDEPVRRVEIRDTEMRFLKSKHVDQTYEIDISLPKDYAQETARYPVLYVLDAEYNFGCIAYIVRRLIKNGDIPKILVVGIAYNTTEDDFYLKRERDCTPPSEIHGSRAGGAENFIRFFEEDLIPTIDRDYRTIPGDRTIVGHSIGGFFGTYVLFTHPDLFGKYLIVSPSLWYSRDVVFQYEREFAERNKTLNAAVFLSTGKDESKQMIRTTDQLIRTIEARKYAAFRFAHLIPEGEHHRSVFPYAFTKGIRWLFGAPN